MAPHKIENLQMFGFHWITSLNNGFLLNICGTWPSTIKVQIELKIEGYAFILTGVMAPDRSDKWKIFVFRPIT